MNKNSLKFKIPFFIMLFAIACVLLTALLFQYIAAQNIEVNILDKNLMISRMISEQINIYLEDAKSTVITAANFSSQSSGDLDEVKREIFRIYDNFSYFNLIFYMNKEARMVFSKPSNDHVKGRIYTDRSYYWEAIFNNNTNISPLLISSVLNEPHFIIASPVYDDAGETIGLIGAGLPLRNIKKVIENTQNHFDGRIWITDKNGIVAIDPHMDNLEDLIKMDNKQINIDGVHSDFESVLRSGQETIGFYTIENKRYYGSFTFVPNVDWMVVVEQDEETVFLEIIQLKRQLKRVLIIVIILALILGLILANKIVNPISMLVKRVRKLSHSLKEIENDGLDLIAEDEIDELEKVFNRMTIQLKESIDELNESYVRENQLQQYLNNILGSAASGIIVMNQEGLITVFNKEAERISGYTANNFMHQNCKDFFKKVNLNLWDTVYDVMKSNKVVSDIEAMMKSRLGKEKIISLTASCVFDKAMNIVGAVLLIKDLTKMKMIEEELKRGDRIRMMGELASSIIHDIGNPLAGISNLIEILKEDLYNQERKNEILSILYEEIYDLNKLVIDFLEFSRSMKLEKEVIDIVELIDKVIHLLKVKTQDKTIHIRKIYPESPMYVPVDRRAIKQVFINILINAIQAVTENGKIDILVEKRKGHIVVQVTDNGVGIDKDRMEQIFDPFYTTKKDGSGLGLSISYKLIKEHEGQIRVESEINKGTKITVDLPVKSLECI